MFTVAAGSDEPKQPRTGGAPPTPKMRRGLKTYLSEVGREMKKVSWPTKKETNRLTGVVMIVCLIVMVILLALGRVFEFLIDLISKGGL